jgi:hypothetical protein
MTGVLAQLIALTSHGNQWLQAGEFPAVFYPQSTVFQFCNLVDFRDYDYKDQQETVIVPDPNRWYGFLKIERCQRLRLYYQPSKPKVGAEEHMLAGMIGGGGTWLIEAIGNGHSDYWVGRWAVTQKDDAEKKIWSVKYFRAYVHQPTNDLHFDLEQTKTDLGEALKAIIAFAEEKAPDNWTDVFKRAAAKLDSDDPIGDYYHQDLIAGKYYSLPAKQLLFSAASAWVFGGMGSWNDLGFDTAEDNQRYSDVSAGLYDAINRSILTAVNSW